MENIIIIIIIVILIAFGIVQTVRHFQGRGACCGGSTHRPRKKKLKHKIIHSYTYIIEGMRCNNCANSITNAINDIEGVAARVNYRKKIAKVVCDRDVDEKLIIEAIRRKGYRIK